MLNYTLLLVSVALLLIAVTINKPFIKNNIIVASIISTIFGCYSASFFIADYFTGKGIDDSVIYHLQYGVGGAGFQEYWLLIVLSGAGVLAFALMPYVLVCRLTKTVQSTAARKMTVFLSLLLAALILNPTAFNLFDYLQIGASLAENEHESSFAEYYRPPEISQVSQKRNVVYIYLESLERTYFDEAVFPGLVKELRHLESIGTSFTNIKQVTGTGWTIAGLTATQCGIPLITPSHGNSMSGMDKFLPNAKCLGDLLSGQDYNLTYISGSSIEFAGVGKLFSTHSFDTVYGRSSLRSRLSDQSYQNGWGLYDDTLLDIALSEFSSLSKQGKPFGLFLSTMDTHHPKGHRSGRCKGKKYKYGYNPILNAVVCTDYLLGNFVRNILASKHAQNTVIVISSDHLALRNTATSMLDRLDRRNLFLVIEPNKKSRKINKEGSMLDVAPTLLPYLGFEGEVGFGRNLLQNEESIISILPINETFKAWKKPFERFWGFPRVSAKDVFVINPIKKNISINQRVFKYPLLVEFENNNDTIMKFQFDRSKGLEPLVDHVARLESGKPFMWIDACKVIRTETFKLPGGYCVVYGRAATRNLVYSDVSEIGGIVVSDVYNAIPNKRIPVRKPIRSEDQINTDSHDVSRFIAHAGGAIGEDRYTNSLEALNLSYEKGLRLFELDISRSSDGIYVAAHDWKYWKNITGYKGILPPSRAVFKQQKIKDKYTPLDIDDINDWFENHPDAVLVTDKVNTPLDFSRKFIDKKRLMMELFSMKAVHEGVQADIKSAMPTWDLLSSVMGDKVQALLDIGVTDIAASRTVIKNNKRLIRDLKDNGIRVYVFHVNVVKGVDETYVICNDMDYIYGLYADKYEYQAEVDCSGYKSISDWYVASHL